ncbi:MULTISPECIES: EAL domain-containing protein [unclassified Paenibacillus]|uniref:EAL domain-containing protein n=1 Tax=unclassified Paenibacillus TaxID=185978 RepID=UPI003645E4A8
MINFKFPTIVGGKMGDTMTVLSYSNWKEKLKMICYLPFSNKSLKYFPPDFSLRDPIVSILQQYRRQGGNCGLLLFYMEDFHHLFATYPHSFIQNLQQHIRITMREVIPTFFKKQDILGIKQFGGEDFCIFIKEHQGFTYDEMHRKSILLRNELERRLRLPARFHEEASYTFQVGCYMINQDIENTEAAIHSAYHYAHSIATKKLPPHFTKSRQHLVDIIQTENISVLTQPIMNLNTGEIFGWEILTRGPHNTPFHSPIELFDFAYQADLLSKMEFLVIKKAFNEIAVRQIREQVFINITPVTLCHPLFLNELLDVMSQHPEVSPSQIVLEITERHAIRNFDYMGHLLTKYRSHGFRFAVDDAGAGYSSLQTISELVPDIIKIDRSLIQNIDKFEVKQSLLRAMLHFAENINCQVIAEGVERQEEADVLYEMQVQMGQGFYFARPEPFIANQDRTQQFRLVKEKIRGNRQVYSA